MIAHPDPVEAARGLIPGFADNESVLLAVGILGATVMPHVIYLHSGLTQHRIVGATEQAKRQIARYETADAVIAIALAGAINVSMLVIAATTFHSRGLTDIGTDRTTVKGASRPTSGTAQRCCSGSRCSPRDCPPPGSERWPAR